MWSDFWEIQLNEKGKVQKSLNATLYKRTGNKEHIYIYSSKKTQK